MKSTSALLIAALYILAPSCLAQKWELGGVAGGGFYNNLTVSNGIGSALAGFQSGMAFGAVLGQNLYPRISGELRYTFHRDDLTLSNAANRATFNGLSHAAHYDLLFHLHPARARVRPFVAVGGGVKMYRGFGTESPYQPLSSFALLTKTQQWKPMLSAGAGTKFAISPRVSLRLEFRDYITQFPAKVIAAAPGAKLGGLVHDFVPMLGLTYTF